MDLKLEGKTALVVASSQGLGKAVAVKLVEEGAQVMISSRDSKKLKKVVQELAKGGRGKIAHTEADITKKADIQKLVDNTVETFGGIDILVNNAGGPPGGGFNDMADEDWQQAFELNLLSYIRLIRTTLPFMVKQGGGRIINVASSSIKQPIPNLILSNTFRMGIVGLAKTLAEELAPKNILIHTVAPGRIATDRVHHLDQLRAEKTGLSLEDVVHEAEASIPLGRYGQPEEFANVVAFLCSEACTYMTGGSFLVDGGMIKAI